jgi:chromosome segregation ATPase
MAIDPEKAADLMRRDYEGLSALVEQTRETVDASEEACNQLASELEGAEMRLDRARRAYVQALDRLDDLARQMEVEMDLAGAR